MTNHHDLDENTWPRLKTTCYDFTKYYFVKNPFIYIYAYWAVFRPIGDFTCPQNLSAICIEVESLGLCAWHSHHVIWLGCIAYPTKNLFHFFFSLFPSFPLPFDPFLSLFNKLKSKKRYPKGIRYLLLYWCKGLQTMDVLVADLELVGNFKSKIMRTLLRPIALARLW